VYEAEWNYVIMNRDGSKFLNLRKVLFREIMFYVFWRDIDRQNCKYGWDNLFRKSSVVKEYGGENQSRRWANK